MDTNARMTRTSRGQVAASIALAAFALATASACNSMGAPRPAESEFGFGPRVSTKHLYVATLQPAEALRLRQLQSVPVRLTDANGRPVEGASIRVDGGMPEHGHGLPTQPKVTALAQGGEYRIEGLRFSMGGWWEVKLAIDSPAGSDTVTFNVAL